MLFLWKNTGTGQKIGSRSGVYICDECIELCSEIIEEEFEEAKVDTELNDIPKPKEIKRNT